jgi:hypothetical protein
LNHPEDIAHFKHAEEEEEKAKAFDALMANNAIIEANIPRKFLREA